MRESLKRSLRTSRTEDEACPVPTDAASAVEMPTSRSMNLCMESPFAAAGPIPDLSSQDRYQPRQTISFDDALKRLRGTEGGSGRWFEPCKYVGVTMDIRNDVQEGARHRREQDRG